MNVSCTSCSAKYAIPDEKVRGKKIKITCRHCGTGVIVDGTKLDPAAAAPGPAPVAPAAPEPSFDVAYPDDRQETLTLGEVVDKYAAGALDDEAFLWREGMPDWKHAFDILEVEAALKARGLTRGGPALAPASTGTQQETTQAPIGSFDPDPAEMTLPGEWREPGEEAPISPPAAFNLRASAPLPREQEAPRAVPQPAQAKPKAMAAAPGAPFDAPQAAAARRSAARGGGDLFGDLAGAGGEEDDSLGSEVKEAAPKMTGARNESSVLFSLDALIKQEQKPAAKKVEPKRDDAAAFLLGSDSAPNSIAHVGTGSFGSALLAPDFNAPVAALPQEARASDPVELSQAAPTKKKGVGLWIGLAAGLALVGGAFATGLPARLAAGPVAAESVNPAAAATPVAARAADTAPPAAQPTALAAEAPVAAASSAALGSATPSQATPAAPEALAAKPADAVAKPADKPADAPAKPADKPADAVAKPADKPADAAAKPADKPAPSDAPPFDKSAAIAALTAAAGNAQSCKTADGPTGGGKVSITFMPSGRATNTQVSGDLAGTAVGGCVARIFRGAKIPAFSGEAVTVSKSFSVQ